MGDNSGGLQVRPGGALRGATPVPGDKSISHRSLMLGALADGGEVTVHGRGMLRVKETDRIAVMAAELRKLGADIEERPDGFALQGPQKLHGAIVDGHDDHRVVMSLVIAGLHAEGTTTITGAHFRRSAQT